ncbi:hypothetical protein [Pseudoduganella lurida]|nr:hypothetical protein [Pseudoduganella lurida]
MTRDELAKLAAQSEAVTASCDCVATPAEGWISYPATLDPQQLAAIGTLVVDAYADTTFAEYHPAGTRYDSADAPVALGWYPYNRAEVARCRKCGRVYLQYVEAGGYFVDRRIRALRAATLVDAPAPD